MKTLNKTHILTSNNLKNLHKIIIYKNFCEKTHSDFEPKVKKQLTDENIIETIDGYVKQNNVCLFMKGTKDMPKCGFSNYLVQVLKFYKITNFKDVNVLESELLRNSVKSYNNWPTFPQL